MSTNVHRGRRAPFGIALLVPLLLLVTGASAWASEGTTGPGAAGLPVAIPVSKTTILPAQGSLTALQLAAQHGMTYQDASTFVMLESRSLRVRMYPGRQNVVVAGQEYTVKDRIARRGRDVVLTSRVAGFLSFQIERFFQQEEMRRRMQRASTVRTPLPPLPRRTAVTRLRAAEPDPLPAPAPVPAPVATRTLPAGNWVPPAAERTWKWIVIHHSDDDSGSVAKYDRYHRETKHWENGCGYHFVIGNGTETGDGEVEMGPRWIRQIQGAHAKTPDNRFNEFGVGICLVGDFHSHGGRPSEAQVESLVGLLRWLQERYGIASQDVRGHCDCCSTNCPGRNFPWAEIRRRLD